MASTHTRIDRDLLLELAAMADTEQRSLKVTIERILKDYLAKWRAGREKNGRRGK